MTGSEDTLTVESRASRVVVGRVSRGCSLRAALQSLVDEHGLQSAWISAIGAFEWIDLTEYNQVTRSYEKAHRFERCELLSMQGNLSLRDGEPFWHLHATVSRREDGRDVTYGGHVDDGVVFALELRIDCFDGLTLRRADDEATGLKLWKASETAGDGATAAGRGGEGATAADERAAGSAWAMAAELSAQASPAPAARAPVKGDWVDHAKFGLCKIEGLSGDGVCILKLPNATRKKIKLTAMQVLPPRQDDGRTIFPLRPKRK